MRELEDSVGSAAHRKSPRRTFQRRVGLLVRGEFCVVQSSQIGEGGMMVVTDRELSGEAVLTFIVPGRNYAYVVVRGNVLYKLPEKVNGMNSYGVQFTNLSFEHKRAVRYYVASKTEVEPEQNAA